MPMTPQDILETQQQNCAEEVRSAVAAAEQQLLKSFTPGEHSTIVHVRLSTEAARRQFISEFVSAGWRVTYKSDQRDGDWYEFKPLGIGGSDE